MNYRFHVSPQTERILDGLPRDGHDSLLAVIEALKVDPFAVSTPWGEDDGITREARFGRFGIMLVFVNPYTRMITPFHITYAG